MDSNLCNKVGGPAGTGSPSQPDKLIISTRYRESAIGTRHSALGNILSSPLLAYASTREPPLKIRGFVQALDRNVWSHPEIVFGSHKLCQG